MSPRGYKMSTRFKSPVTYRQHEAVRPCVISTKIVTRRVTISVVLTLSGRRFGADAHPNIENYRISFKS
jgi:hypothetical protein